MDAVILFALPLVGGLIFCSHWNFTRWRVAREDGHRLYFRAVFFGAILSVFIAWTRSILEGHFPECSAFVSSLKDYIKPLAKEEKSATAIADLAVTCFITMLAGWPLAKLLNLFFWKEFWLRYAIKKDSLEAFLLDSADRERPIAVTMDDGKVYVGYIVEGFDPAILRKTIFLLPLMSGYRDDKTHKVNFTTYYTKLYGEGAGADFTQPLPGSLAHLTPEQFITAIVADRIVSYRLFDATAYLEFQKSNPMLPPPQEEPTPIIG